MLRTTKIGARFPGVVLTPAARCRFLIKFKSLSLFLILILNLTLMPNIVSHTYILHFSLVLSPNDRDLILSKGLAVVDCSWNQIEKTPISRIKVFHSLQPYIGPVLLILRLGSRKPFAALFDCC